MKQNNFWLLFAIMLIITMGQASAQNYMQAEINVNEAGTAEVKELYQADSTAVDSLTLAMKRPRDIISAEDMEGKIIMKQEGSTMAFQPRKQEKDYSFTTKYSS